MRRWLHDLWVIAVGIASLFLLLIAPSLMRYYSVLQSPGYYSIFQYPVETLIPLVVFGTFFLYRFRLPDLWPRGLKGQDLLNAFRRAGSTAERGARGITIRLGRTAAVSFPLDQDGTLKGRYVVGATSYGYGVILMLFIIWPLAPLSIILVIYNVLKARKLIFSGVPQGAEGHEHRGALNAPLRSMMIDNLSELSRISNEAYESARSDYQDRIVIGVLVALAAWMMFFAVAFGFLGWQTMSPSLRLAASLVLPMLLFLAYYLRLRRNVLPEVERTRRWAQRLDLAFKAEVGDAVPKDDSSLQTVLEALNNLPEWLELRRKSMAFRHPGTTVVVLVAFTMAFALGAVAYSSWAGGDEIMALALATGAGGGLAAGSFIYRWQAKADRAEAQEALKWFRGRIDKLNEFMGTSIREL